MLSSSSSATSSSALRRLRPARLVAVAALLATGLGLAGSAEPVQASAGTRPFAALMCKFADKPNTYGFGPETIQKTLTGGGMDVDGYLKEMSLGTASIAGSKAWGWFDLPKAQSAYGTDWAGAADLTRDCVASAQAKGTDLGGFDNVMVYVNDQLPGAEGRTVPVDVTIGGQTKPVTAVLLTWRGLNSPPLLLHELGHVFGAGHTSGKTDPLGYAAYGDRPNNTLFGSPRPVTVGPGFDAPTRDAMGWIPADRKAQYTGGTQSFTLTRLTQPASTGSMMVTIPIPGSEARYVVYARTRTGYDAQKSLANGNDQFGYSLVQTGVRIDRVTPGADTVALLSDPAADPLSAAQVWVGGQAFTDPSNGLKIAVDRFDQDGAQVTVSGGTATPPSTTTTTAPPVTQAPTTVAPPTTAPPTTTSPTTASPSTEAPATTAPTTAAPTTAPPAPTTGASPSDGLAGAPVATVPSTFAPMGTTGLTTEAGEPMPCGGVGATVWVKVTVPASGRFTASTVGSTYDTIIGAYRVADPNAPGFAGLATIGCADDTATGPQAEITLTGPPGGTIYVQVGGYAGEVGTLNLSFR